MKLSRYRTYRKDLRQRRETKTISGRKIKIWKTNKNVPGRGVGIKATGRAWDKCGSEERRMHLNKLPWKKLGKGSQVYKGRVADSEWIGRQAGDRLRWTLQLNFWGMNKGSESSWKKGVSGERMWNRKKSVFHLLWGINSALPFIGVSYLLTKNTSLWSPNIWKLFPTTPSSSQILAGCPRIQLNSDTIYQNTVSDPTG